MSQAGQQGRSPRTGDDSRLGGAPLGRRRRPAGGARPARKRVAAARHRGRPSRRRVVSGGGTSMIRRIAAVARNTHLESIRQRIVVALLVFGFLLMASALILKDISVHQDAKVLGDIGL